MGRLTLVVGDFVARLVDACEAEVAILPDLTVFGTIDRHGFISCGTEFLAMGVVDLKTDSLSTEPVA